MISFYLGYRTENIANLEKEIAISNKPALGGLWEESRRVSRDFVGSLIRDLRAEIARRNGVQPVDSQAQKPAPPQEPEAPRGNVSVEPTNLDTVSFLRRLAAKIRGLI